MICLVGLNCLDIVSFVPKFPGEDTDSRCTKQVWARGGNASNNATILACLGQSVEFFGTLANDHLLRFFTEDMNQAGIKYDNCPIIEGITKAPTSVVLCSEQTGSRTIVHSKGDLPELSLGDFESKINLANYTWVHFEGRNEAEVVKMIKVIHAYNAKYPKPSCGEDYVANYQNVRVPISVEVEKCRDPLSDLLPLAHVVFVGKDFAAWKGAKDKSQAVKLMLPKVSQGTLVICPWGESGAAYGICGTGNLDGNQGESDSSDYGIRKIDAVPPTQLIDSLGAGDTFTATTILCLNKGMSAEDSVRMGCRIASEKLAMYGFQGLKEKAGIIWSGEESAQ